MEGLRRLRSFIEGLIRVAATIGTFFVLPLMFITAGDVVGRGFLNKPIAGTFELSECMLALIILLGAAYTQQVKGHVAVDFLTSKFSGTMQAMCRMITLFLSLSVVSLLVWQGFKLGVEETGVTDQLRVPLGPFKMLVGIGGGLLWLQLFLDFIDSAGKVARRYF